MVKPRIIPSLLLSNEGLVKTIKFSKPKYVGDPINAIKIFNDKEVDELIVLDINASKNNQEPNYDLIEQFASECFMPLCYGGGIKTIEHAKKIFSLGVEKISLQSAVLDFDLSIIKKMSEQFGSQSIVVSLDLKKDWKGNCKIYNSRTGKLLKKDWNEFLINLQNGGAGEILINSVDRDGTFQGLDCQLIKSASNSINIPLIAQGGVGSLEHIAQGFINGASAVSVGAFFVFHGPHRAVLITYPNKNEIKEIEDIVNGKQC